MFTGIVERACPLLAATPGEGRVRLLIDLAPLLGEDPPEPGPPARPGDSVAVNGVCLTVAALEGTRAAFDVVPETLACTNLGGLHPADRVNVERALRFGERVDGHLVQGHVERTGVVAAAEPAGGELRLSVTCGADFARRCLPKGSVAVDGVSLTVAELADDRFTVALVPHTLERTVLGERRPGDTVNLEADMIGQWVARVVGEMLPAAPR